MSIYGSIVELHNLEPMDIWANVDISRAYELRNGPKLTSTPFRYNDE